jgi:hypothetical protein
METGTKCKRLCQSRERIVEPGLIWLEVEGPPERAAQRVRFIDQYGAYVINYNLGQDLVASYVERHAGTDPALRWSEFAKLISSPRLPSGLED